MVKGRFHSIHLPVIHRIIIQFQTRGGSNGLKTENLIFMKVSPFAFIRGFQISAVGVKTVDDDVKILTSTSKFLGTQWRASRIKHSLFLT